MEILAKIKLSDLKEPSKEIFANELNYLSNVNFLKENLGIFFLPFSPRLIL